LLFNYVPIAIKLGRGFLINHEVNLDELMTCSRKPPDVLLLVYIHCECLLLITGLVKVILDWRIL